MTRCCVVLLSVVTILMCVAGGECWFGSETTTEFTCSTYCEEAGYPLCAFDPWFVEKLGFVLGTRLGFRSFESKCLMKKYNACYHTGYTTVREYEYCVPGDVDKLISDSSFLKKFRFV